VQHFVQQDAGMIAGERPATAIRAVHAGRQADNQKSGGRIAEWRDRPVNNMSAVIDNGKITSYRVNLQITFEVEDAGPAAKRRK
jgi:hypothetical protein